MRRILYSVGLLLSGAVFGGVVMNFHSRNSVPVIDTVRLLRMDTIVRHDTLRVSVPVYTESPATRTVTPGREMLERMDSDSIVLRTVSRVYADSLFRAVVSGVDPRLDSLTIYNSVPLVTRTIAVKSNDGRKIPRFGIGVSAGLTATPKGLSPGVTLGLYYRLWP